MWNKGVIWEICAKRAPIYFCTFDAAGPPDNNSCGRDRLREACLHIVFLKGARNINLLAGPCQGRLSYLGRLIAYVANVILMVLRTATLRLRTLATARGARTDSTLRKPGESWGWEGRGLPASAWRGTGFLLANL